MDITYLSWDSKFFSKEIYKASVNAELSGEEIATLKNLKAELIYVFVSDIFKEQRVKLEEIGAKLYDKKVTYIKVVSTNLNPEFTVTFELIEKLRSSIEKMAYQSGTYSRFNLDPRLSVYYKKLYYTWIAKSVQREIAEEVIVAKEGDADVGFISLSVKDGVGIIGLIAVDENNRGRKIASQLLTKAELWFAEHKIETYEVVTQLDNYPACSLYEKNNFVQNKLEYIYHYWKS